MSPNEAAEQPSRTPNQYIVFGKVIHITTILRVIGVGWVGFVSWWIEGIVGLGIALILAGIAVGTTPVITTVFAHIGLFVMQPDLGTTTGGLQFALFEFGVLVFINSEPPLSFPTGLITTAFIGGVVLLTLGVFSSTGLVETSVILCCLAIGVGYLIHRYGQVSLGLITSEQNNR